MKRTKQSVRYKMHYRQITIPAGTPVTPADNLPQGGYWAEPWEGMSVEEESWQRNYGFFIEEDEVEDCE